MTILNTTPPFNPSVALSIIVMVVVGVIVFAFSACLISDDFDIGAVLAGIAIALVVVGIMTVIGVHTYNQKKGRSEVECIISDDAKFKEILDKYEVIDQRGDIYVLSEKKKEAGDERGN